MNNPEPARVRWGAAPSLDDIAAMARAALDTLEEPFRTPARAVAIKVEDFADDETLESMKIENPYDLTGLYSGVALTLEQVMRQQVRLVMSNVDRRVNMDRNASLTRAQAERDVLAHWIAAQFRLLKPGERLVVVLVPDRL